ncbi:membrane-bound lytic murein transglycosylase F [Betaproteobacteria bacterium]|nr:membrane-bound lytic murein transglycosylase F [Betaproteobacteria bacterium]GHU01559.1 membrane-bound lytic murein transglycosylase F [Betaproteobacteria bacterium]GHU16642.1 membrane-bound lytic murein transglycosylase F [Betaproteobacteria bacterium]
MASTRFAPVRFVSAALLVLLAACGQDERLKDFQTHGELRVATVADGLSYRRDEDGAQSGFEHDLLLDLGQRLNVPVRFVEYPNAGHALEAVVNGHAHLAAAGLTRNASLPLVWTTPLRELDFILAGQKGGRKISRLADLAGRVVTVMPGTQAASAIEQLAAKVPALEVVYADADDQTLLTRLANGQIDLLATDRVHFALAARTSPQLTIAFNLPHESEVVWALPPNIDGGLSREISIFLSEARESGLLARVSDRYFGHVRRLNGQDVIAFLGHIEQRLPLYLPHFLDASARTGIDWRYLAALSYQESHWNPGAESRTGVRGLMMLTNDTASRLGIRNRIDPRQSILGGARYIAMLQNELPDEVPDPDRLWMATAAYNLGMGHFNGARTLARQLGKDNTSWLEMKSVLPLISRPQYRLKGSPRGYEALIMTENIRNYYDILLQQPTPPLLGERNLGPRLHAQAEP